MPLDLTTIELRLLPSDLPMTHGNRVRVVLAAVHELGIRSGALSGFDMGGATRRGTRRKDAVSGRRPSRIVPSLQGVEA